MIDSNHETRHAQQGRDPYMGPWALDPEEPVLTLSAQVLKLAFVAIDIFTLVLEGALPDRCGTDPSDAAFDPRMDSDIQKFIKSLISFAWDGDGLNHLKAKDFESIARKVRRRTL